MRSAFLIVRLKVIRGQPIGREFETHPFNEAMRGGVRSSKSKSTHDNSFANAFLLALTG